MRIYAVADIHAKENRIDEMKSIIDTHSPDLLIIAGDITNYFFQYKTIKQFENIHIPIYFIRGNSDFKRTEKLIRNLKNGTLLDSSPTTFQNFEFLGINGTIPLPFLSKLKWNESKVLNPLIHKITKYTIVVAHPPPRGSCDKVGNRFSAGSHMFKNFIVNYPPLLVICGHIHEQTGCHFLNKTAIVNCAINKNYIGAIIDCDEGRPLIIKIIERINQKTVLFDKKN